MKFNFLKSDFQKELAYVSKAIDKNNPIPALAFVKIKAEKGEVELTGSNGTITLISTIKCDDIKEEGSTLIDSQYLNQLISKSSVDIISLETEKDVAKIQCGKSKYKLKTLNVENYIPNKDIDNYWSVNISSKTIQDIVSKCSFSTSKADYRPILQGVNLNYNSGKLIATATDSYRMSRITLQCKQENENTMNIFNFTLHSSAIKLLSGFFDKDIKVEVDKNTAKFSSENHICYTQLLEGEYPNVERLIPNNFDSEIKFIPNELYEAVSRSSFIKTDDHLSIIDLELENGKIIVRNNSDKVNEFEEEVDVDNSISWKCSLNCNYLLQALKSFDKNKKVKLNFFKEAIKPFLLEQDENKQLLLPVKKY